MVRFTTGSNPSGYNLNSFTVRQILFSSGNGGTYRNFPSGCSLQVRFGTISGSTLTPILTTNATYSGPTIAGAGYSGTGDYFTFDLSGAGIGTLAPNTTYFVELAITGGLYFELFNQLNPTSFTGGTSFTGDNAGALDAVFTVNLTAGEFAFDASMSAVGTPVIVTTTDHPFGAVPGDSVTFTATITPGNGTVTNVNLDLSVIGGSSANNLVLSNANVYTNTFTIPAGAPIGTTNLTVIALQNAAPLAGGLYFPFTVYSPVPPTIFGVYRQRWSNLDSSLGNTLMELTNTSYNPSWPNNPDPTYTQVFPGFETEVNDGVNYWGQRLRAFVVPPTNGNYTFWIASDDASQLFISTNETPENERAVASVSTWTSWRNFSTEPNQQSSPVYLQGGQRYYIEALMQQGSGGDDLTVQWQLPNGTIELPLATGSATGTLLVPFTGLTNMPGIFLQPATNTVSLETGTATFSLLATNPAPVSYQWRLSGTNVPGANSSVLVLSNLNLSWNGQSFVCVISNMAGSVTSTPSILAVRADTNPPTILNVVNLGLTNVQVSYSKMVEAASATNAANYVFTNGLAVTRAVLNADNQTVVLTTVPLTYGSNYCIVVNHVRDRATVPNTIATNTVVSFAPLPYAPQDLGNPAVPSTITVVSNGFNVTAAGADFAGNSDQGNFSYQIYSGNFDVAVRVAGLTLSDIFAKAGLMARESLTASSRFAAAFTTPAMNGSFFEWRDPAGNAASTSGNYPANYPNTWLRLNRVGNTFTGFASYDGQVWTQLGSATISMPGQIYLGFSVSSRSASAVATAQFRDITTVTNAVVGVVVNPHDAMGPSSRKSPIVFSEIMYKPAPRTDGKNLEFVEIYNSNPWFQDISGYHITCADMNYTFPPNTQILGGGYLVIAAAPADIQSVYGITNVMGPYTGSLKKTETLQMLDEQGAVLLTVPYSNVNPWPVAADGTGHSLVLAYPTSGEGDSRAWDISDTVGGSPGQMDAFTPSPLRNVVINEFLAHTDPPDYDYIELYNHSTNSVDISGCILTDNAATNKFVIPSGTIIPPRGFVFYSETNMNFALNALGETIFFIKPDGSRILDAVQFATQQNGVAMGRWPDGANDFYRLQAKTPGAPNAPILISDVVINELMYNPISGNDDDQYVELYNRSTNTINLSGWQLAGGVTFAFPSITIPTNGYIVVARNLTNLFAKYPNLNATNAVGNFSGKLSHNGEYLALTMPAEHKTTGTNGVTVTNIINIAINDLTYGTGGRWGEWSGGGGSSLELIDPNSNNRLAANWADSDETPKSVWTNIEMHRRARQRRQLRQLD